VGTVVAAEAGAAFDSESKKMTVIIKLVRLAANKDLCSLVAHLPPHQR
jgi:uncharacterized membrane protein YadS